VKRTTVLLPLLLPRLSDQAAAQLIELLHELLAAIEHQYAAQIQRYRKHQREIQRNHSSPKTDSPFDPPF
jgi:hypothetical protein